MAGQIIGVNKSSLWLAWKEIRAQLRNASVRDVIDFLDYDIEPNVWIERMLRHISSGGFRAKPSVSISTREVTQLQTDSHVPCHPRPRSVSGNRRLHSSPSKEVPATTCLLPTRRFSQSHDSRTASRRGR